MQKQGQQTLVSQPKCQSTKTPIHQISSIRKGVDFQKFPSEITKIILDVDTGCDDAHCILLLGYLAQKFNKQIIGITCTKGNTTLENVITNTLISVKKTGLKTKIYAGSSKNIMDYVSSDDYFGLDGLNNMQQKYKAQLTKEDFQLVQKESAYNFISESARKYGKQLILCCAAPLTNIAISYLIDNQIPNLIAGITIMGGSYSGIGMNEVFSAQFNFWGDIEAAAIVLQQFKNIVLIPLETAFEYPKGQFKQIFYQQSTEKGRFISDIYKGMNPLLCDPLILFPVFYPQAIRKVYNVYGQISKQGLRTRGFLAINWMPTPETSNLIPNLQIVYDIDFTFINNVMKCLVSE